jgi:hypothetical protein
LGATWGLGLAALAAVAFMHSFAATFVATWRDGAVM